VALSDKCRLRSGNGKAGDTEVRVGGMASRDDRETWRVQLNEARAEWKRRHPKDSES
jgi:hypothetical protein